MKNQIFENHQLIEGIIDNVVEFIQRCVTNV